MKYELSPNFTVPFASDLLWFCWGQVDEVRYFPAIVLAGITGGRLQVWPSTWCPKM